MTRLPCADYQMVLGEPFGPAEQQAAASLIARQYSGLLYDKSLADEPLASTVDDHIVHLTYFRILVWVSDLIGRPLIMDWKSV